VDLNVLSQCKGELSKQHIALQNARHIETWKLVSIIFPQIHRIKAIYSIRCWKAVYLSYWNRTIYLLYWNKSFIMLPVSCSRRRSLPQHWLNQRCKEMSVNSVHKETQRSKREISFYFLQWKHENSPFSVLEAANSLGLVRLKSAGLLGLKGNGTLTSCRHEHERIFKMLRCSGKSNHYSLCVRFTSSSDW